MLILIAHVLTTASFNCMFALMILQDLHAKFPPADPELFRKWFPGLKLSRTSTDSPRYAHEVIEMLEVAAPKPADACRTLMIFDVPFCRRGVVLCFHNAGNEENMYTSEGLGARKAPSPLLVNHQKAVSFYYHDSRALDLLQF